MGALSALPNIGKVVEQQLMQAGIDTVDKLRAQGSRNAWLAIRALDPSACYHRLCALEGAIAGVRWHDLPDGVKAELKEFYNAQTK